MDILSTDRNSRNRIHLNLTGEVKIRNRESKEAEERCKTENEKEEVSKEEHEARLKMLKDMGLVK